MKVESIDSRMPIKFCGPRAQEKLPEGVKLLAGVALTLWTPSLFYCLVTGQILPLYVVACNQALGVLLGVWMYERQPRGLASCVPANRIPNVPSGPPIREMDKAA